MVPGLLGCCGNAIAVTEEWLLLATAWHKGGTGLADYFGVARYHNTPAPWNASGFPPAGFAPAPFAGGLEPFGNMLPLGAPAANASLALAACGGSVYAALNTTRQLVVVDPATMRVVANRTLPGALAAHPPFQLACGPAAGALLAATHAGVYLLDVSGHVLVARTLVADLWAPGPLALHAPSQTLFVADNHRARLQVRIYDLAPAASGALARAVGAFGRAGGIFTNTSTAGRMAATAFAAPIAGVGVAAPAALFVAHGPQADLRRFDAGQATPSSAAAWAAALGAVDAPAWTRQCTVFQKTGDLSRANDSVAFTPLAAYDLDWAADMTRAESGFWAHRAWTFDDEQFPADYRRVGHMVATAAVRGFRAPGGGAVVDIQYSMCMGDMVSVHRFRAPGAQAVPCAIFAHASTPPDPVYAHALVGRYSFSKKKKKKKKKEKKREKRMKREK